VGELEGRTVVVLGGAGKVGSAIALASLKAGAGVAVPSRSPERLGRLRTRAGALSARLTTLEADVGREEEARRVRDWVNDRLGAYDAVVVALGGYWRGGSAIDTPLAVWRERLEENLLTHVVAARVFLPPLLARPGSAYVAINGLAADAPRPGSAPICVTGAAQEMLVRQLAAEHRQSAVRIATVMLGPVRTPETDPALADAHPEWLTAEEVGEFVAHLLGPGGRMVHDTVVRLPSRPAGA
jgi:NAD(P)-dependent dehydrogenase (short-subunit alcohol dehydrogenase family)